MEGQSGMMATDSFQAALRLHQKGDIPSAVEHYQAILRHHPTHAGARHLLGVAFQQQGEHSLAAEQLSRALALNDSKAVYHNNYAVTLRSLGRLDQAQRAAETAARINPGYADAHSNLGLILCDRRRPKEAIACFERALELVPGHPDALFNLANLLSELGRREEAIALYKRGIETQPNRPGLYNNLGNALLALERPDEAVTSYQRAIQLDPGYAEAQRNLGSAYAQLEMVDEAQVAFQVAGRLRPDKPLWRMRALSICPAVFQTEEELDRYRRELDKRLDACLASPLQVDVDEMAEEGFTPPFNLAHHGRDNRPLMEKYASLFEPHIPQHEPRPSGGKRRIGFLVTRPHEAGFLRAMAGVVEQLDGERFQPVVLCPPESIAACRRRIRRSDVQWVEVPARFREAAAAILSARCDLLYFRKVTADPLAYCLAMPRLAPIVCTSWGTHLTSGVKGVDYYVSTGLIEAEDADEQYTESLVRLETIPSYERRPGPIAPASRDELGLPVRGGLYLAPQRLAKFHPAQDGLFRDILDRDPEGHLVLLEGGSPRALEQLLARFAKTLGPAARRVLVLPKQAPEQLRRLLSVGDAFLDHHHYGASLMAYDAFAAGVPIVALPGKLKVERYALAFYRKMGIEGALASSPEDYVECAVRLGSDRDYREHLRGEIVERRGVLFEDTTVVREHERFFTEAFDNAGT